MKSKLMSWMVAAVFMSPLATGCEEKTATESAPAKAPAASTDAPWEKDITADCPTHPGKSTIVLDDIDGGYSLTITNTSKSDAQRVADNARYVAGASRHSKPPEDALKFGGRTGDRNTNCAVILEGTTVTQKAVDGGAKLEIRAKDASQVDALRKKGRVKLAIFIESRDAMRKALELD